MGKLGTGKPQKSRKHNKLKKVNEYNEGKPFLGKRKQRVVNSRPEDLDQELPRKVKDIMYFQKGIKERSIKKQKRKRDYHTKSLGNGPMEHGMTKPLKPVPQFKKRPGERERTFLNRVDREAQAVITQSQLEEKYQVDFDQTKDGKSVVKKRTKISDSKKGRLKQKDIKKKLKKFNKKHGKIDEFDALRDEIKFGEVVDQPPQLTAFPRKSKAAVDNRPGKKSLLLKDTLNENSAQNVQKSGQIKQQRQLGQTVKRKHLSLSQQVKIDAERIRVVDLYRQMKAKKMKVCD